MELILVRPKRSDKSRFEFHIYTKETFKSTGFKKLGKYSKTAEEWCHKDDFEYYKELINKGDE